jgi:uncharacterized membrane protein
VPTLDPIPDYEPWQARIGSWIVRSAANRRARAKRSSTKSLVFGAAHAVPILILAATTGVGFELALGIVVLLIIALRLVVHLHRRGQSSSERAAVDPFGR